MNVVDWYTRFIEKLEEESLNSNNSSAVQELLDSQARERLEAKAMRLKHLGFSLGFSEEEVEEEQEKLFDAQVKWAFDKAVDYIRTNGLQSLRQESVLEFFTSIMIQEIEKLSNCNITRIRTEPDHGGITLIIVEGLAVNEKKKLIKTIKFDDRIFDPLPLPSNFDSPEERTTIDEDLINFLIK